MWSIPARGFCRGQVQALTNTRWLNKVRLVTSQMNNNIARLTTRKPLSRILTPHRGAGYWSRMRWCGVNWVEPLEEFGCYEHHTCLFRAGHLDFEDPSNCSLESTRRNWQMDLGVYYGHYWAHTSCTSQNGTISDLRTMNSCTAIYVCYVVLPKIWCMLWNAMALWVTTSWSAGLCSWQRCYGLLYAKIWFCWCEIFILFWLVLFVQPHCINKSTEYCKIKMALSICNPLWWGIWSWVCNLASSPWKGSLSERGNTSIWWCWVVGLLLQLCNNHVHQLE